MAAVPGTERWRALQLLLDALHFEPADRSAALRALTSDCWIPVFQVANEHLLGPALASSLLADLPSGRALPNDVLEYLRLLHDSNGRRNETVKKQALELAEALNSAGIRPLFLKGALGLLVDLKRDPAARVMADIDIVVPKTARRQAEEVLAALGYVISDRYPEGHHAVGEFQRPGDPASIDLHLELIDQDYVLPAAEVLARARTVEHARARFLVPDATDRILHALLHAQIHHLGNYYRCCIGLGQLYDVATILKLHAQRVDWDGIERRLAAHRLTAVLDSYLVAAHDLFGLPWPLDRSPARAGRWHFRCCLLVLRLPMLRPIAVPLGNFRGAFAWHRMRAAYGVRGGPLYWQYRHAVQFLKRHDLRQTVRRVLR